MATILDQGIFEPSSSKGSLLREGSLLGLRMQEVLHRTRVCSPQEGEDWRGWEFPNLFMSEHKATTEMNGLASLCSHTYTPAWHWSVSRVALVSLNGIPIKLSYVPDNMPANLL